jgi:SAM-dependent MidA family methyltransferase
MTSSALTAPGWLPWREAMETALYGADGFYLRPEGPAGHFRTSAHASPRFAAALVELAETCGLTTVVDVGAGRGELLRAVCELRPGWRLVGVELAARPDGLPSGIEWWTELPQVEAALLVANEWLDVVPLDVVELSADGPRGIEVDPASGDERPGPPPSDADLAWLARWWPLEHVGARAEVGRLRDDAWAAAVASLGRGVAVAVDYAHDRAGRTSGAYAGGTLTGYRAGRQVRPVPDGSCDLTAHVALDACAAAGEAAGATATALLPQRDALRALGVSGALPAYELARSDPQGYVAAVAGANEEAELLAPEGLGGFTWLVQAVATPLPPPLRRANEGMARIHTHRARGSPVSAP